MQYIRSAMEFYWFDMISSSIAPLINNLKRISEVSFQFFPICNIHPLKEAWKEVNYGTSHELRTQLRLLRTILDYILLRNRTYPGILLQSLIVTWYTLQFYLHKSNKRLSHALMENDDKKIR